MNSLKLTICGIDKSYGNNHALSDFTATLSPGLYALLGPNGSGKSTLINIITGNLKADAGEIYYSEEGGTPQNIRKMGIHFRRLLGYMPQYPGFYQNFSIEQFMWYIATLKGLGKIEAEKQIDAILDRVELSDLRRKRIKTLSGGMKQRLGLAQAVLGDPQILILDEPTAGLDPKQRITIQKYISEISLDRIVILATHVISDIENTAKEIILLKKGKTVNIATKDKLIDVVKGSVWHVCCAPEQVSEMLQKHHVVNIQNSDNEVLLRVISETAPTTAAVSVAPTLEDYYLMLYNENQL